MSTNVNWAPASFHQLQRCKLAIDDLLRKMEGIQQFEIRDIDSLKELSQTIDSALSTSVSQVLQTTLTDIQDNISTLTHDEATHLIYSEQFQNALTQLSPTQRTEQLNKLNPLLQQYNAMINSTLNIMREATQTLSEEYTSPRGLHGVIFALRSLNNLTDIELPSHFHVTLATVCTELNAIYQQDPQPNEAELVQACDQGLEKIENLLMQFFRSRKSTQTSFSDAERNLIEIFTGAHSELSYIRKQAPIRSLLEEIKLLNRDAQAPALREIFEGLIQYIQSWIRVLRAEQVRLRLLERLEIQGQQRGIHFNWDAVMKPDSKDFFFEKKVAHVAKRTSQVQFLSMGQCGGLCYGLSTLWVENFLNHHNTDHAETFNEQLHQGLGLNPKVTRRHAQQHHASAQGIRHDNAQAKFQDLLAQQKAMLLRLTSPTNTGHAIAVGQNQHGFWLYDPNYGTFQFNQNVTSEQLQKEVNRYQQAHYPELSLTHIDTPTPAPSVLPQPRPDRVSPK